MSKLYCKERKLEVEFMAIISTVKYGALANLGNYENEKIEIEATCQEGDNWEQVLEDLKLKVHSQLHKESDYRQYVHEYYVAKRKLEDIQEKIEKAQQTWDTVSTFMVAQGLKTDTAKFPDIPKLMPSANESHDAELIDTSHF